MDVEALIGTTIMTSQSMVASPAPSTPLPALAEDEYNVFVPNLGTDSSKKSTSSANSSASAIGTSTTTNGEVAYVAGAKSKSMADTYKLFRNTGDVFMAVDGVSTAKKTTKEVKAMIAKSVNTKEFSYFRMRDIKHGQTSAPVAPLSGSKTMGEKEGQLPGELQKKEIQRDMDIIVHSVKIKDLQVLEIQKEVAELKKKLEGKQKELEALDEQDQSWLEQKLTEMKARKHKGLVWPTGF